MAEGGEYQKMSRAELAAAMKEIQEKIAEVQEDRDMVLGQTGQHISGYFRHRFDAELASLNAALANIKNTLEMKE